MACRKRKNEQLQNPRKKRPILNFEEPNRAWAPTSDFINEVSSAMHEKGRIESFRVWFNLHSEDENTINGWIGSALKRKARSIQLYFGMNYHHAIPRHFLNHPNVKLLTNVSLKYLKVTEELFSDFLSQCPSLEVFTVVGSKDIKRLKVDHPHKLKFLTIRRCDNLENVVISCPTLECFKLIAKRNVPIILQSVPLLDNLICGTLKDGFTASLEVLYFFPYFSQLQVLVLHIDERYTRFGTFPELSKLKYLELRINSKNCVLLPFMVVLKACPVLERFFIKKPTAYLLLLQPSASTKTENFILPKYPLESLKEFGICGFYGVEAEVEVFSYIVQNASNLERITLSYLAGIVSTAQLNEDLRYYSPSIAPIVEDAFKRAKDCAKNLDVPSTVELVIED